MRLTAFLISLIFSSMEGAACVSITFSEKYQIFSPENSYLFSSNSNANVSKSTVIPSSGFCDFEDKIARLIISLL